MSLNVSAEVEARILANAQQAGVSIEDYLEQVLGESEKVAAVEDEPRAHRRMIGPQSCSAVHRSNRTPGYDPHCE
jgi:hypothetical protein